MAGCRKRMLTKISPKHKPPARRRLKIRTNLTHSVLAYAHPRSLTSIDRCRHCTCAWMRRRKRTAEDLFDRICWRRWNERPPWNKIWPSTATQRQSRKIFRRHDRTALARLACWSRRRHDGSDKVPLVEIKDVFCSSFTYRPRGQLDLGPA